MTPDTVRRWAVVLTTPAGLAATLTATLTATATALSASVLLLVGPAQAHDDGPVVAPQVPRSAVAADAPVQSGNIRSIDQEPGQVGISGCFLSSAPLYVTSGLESLKVFDVSSPRDPELVGRLDNALFENEAMTCGERRTADGVERFALIGVDLVQASPDDPQHVNLGGGELVVVDVTDAADPSIRSRSEVSTSTHTVACVQPRSCDHAYTAGSRGEFSVLDLSDLDQPVEVDSSPEEDGTQAFASPTAGHKWNFDRAQVGTHTGFGGASMWDVSEPRRPALITTTGAAGRGESERFPGYNDFILHNSFRPHARAFRPGVAPSLANGNVLLVTEEDYEQTDCSLAGSFQTWWVKRLDGSPSAIVPLDKVELADLGTFPLPRGAFCSAHWFDYRQGGLVAAGFYGGGTQVLDVRDPRDIVSHAHSVWGLSEVWDAMWVPRYRNGRATQRRTDVLYAVDLVRGLDVYDVRVPGEPADKG